MSYFWSGYSLQDFLFSGFNIASGGEFTGIFFGVLSAAIIYEGIRTLRDFLLNRFITSRSPNNDICKISNGNSNNGANKVECAQSENSMCMKTVNNGDLVEYECEPGGNKKSTGYERKENDAAIIPSNSPSENEMASSSKPCENNSTGKNIRRPKVEFLVLILSSLLHMIYIFLGYTLMLAVMTYNVWILVAVAIGVGIGYFLFDMFRRNDLMKRSDIINTLVSSNTKRQRQISCNSEFSRQTTDTTLKLD